MNTIKLINEEDIKLTYIEKVLGVDLVSCEPITEEEILQKYLPELWVNEDKHILNENVFAEYFTEMNNLQYNNGLFYTRYGRDTEEVLSHNIWESLRDNRMINTNVERTVKKLLGATKLAATVESLTMDENVIPFANGDFIVSDWQFRENDFQPVPYRLPVVLSEKQQKKPYFEKWLDDLFFPDDIKVLQEYIGYSLVSSTKAQKALFLVGEGGSGKSGLGVILESILGAAMMSTSNTQEFLQDKFKQPELENKLVLYDDDLDSQALTETGFYKKLITNNIAITADRKYGQPFSFTPKVKLIACCNQMLSSVYDNTTGFWRRLLPIIVRPLSPDFKPDLRFYDKLRREREGIVQWALVGLRRLIKNDWVLSESDRTKEYLSTKQSIDNPIPDFFGTCFETTGDPRDTVTSTDVLSVFGQWCRFNNVNQSKPRTVQTWLSDNSEKLGIKQSNHVDGPDGRHVRGYICIKIRSEWSPLGSSRIETDDGKIKLT